MMWEKYMYFLNSPSKFENLCWWKKNINTKNNTNKLRCKNCAPFKIKIIDKVNKDNRSIIFDILKLINERGEFYLGTLSTQWFVEKSSNLEAMI